jgi:hypothetical protein
MCETRTVHKETDPFDYCLMFHFFVSSLMDFFGGVLSCLLEICCTWYSKICAKSSCENKICDIKQKIRVKSISEIMWTLWYNSTETSVEQYLNRK